MITQKACTNTACTSAWHEHIRGTPYAESNDQVLVLVYSSYKRTSDAVVSLDIALHNHVFRYSPRKWSGGICRDRYLYPIQTIDAAILSHVQRITPTDIHDIGRLAWPLVLPKIRTCMHLQSLLSQGRHARKRLEWPHGRSWFISTLVRMYITVDFA
jgi:hypothetical protein